MTASSTFERLLRARSVSSRTTALWHADLNYSFYWIGKSKRAMQILTSHSYVAGRSTMAREFLLQAPNLTVSLVKGTSAAPRLRVDEPNYVGIQDTFQLASVRG
jgi:hypothetical protein